MEVDSSSCLSPQDHLRGVNIDKCRNQFQKLTLTPPQDHQKNLVGDDNGIGVKPFGRKPQQQDHTGIINGKQQQDSDSDSDEDEDEDEDEDDDNDDEVLFAKLVDMIRKNPYDFVEGNHDNCCDGRSSPPTSYESSEDKEEDDLDEDTFNINQIDDDMDEDTLGRSSPSVAF